MYRRQLYGRGASPVNWLILVAFSREDSISTRVLVRCHSNSTVFMGPHPCVNGIPPHVYHRYRGYTVTVV